MEIVSATALSRVASSVLPEVPPSPEPPQAVTTSAVASTVAATLVDWRSFTGFLSEGAGAASAGDEPRCSWAARADPRRGSDRWYRGAHPSVRRSNGQTAELARTGGRWGCEPRRHPVAGQRLRTATRRGDRVVVYDGPGATPLSGTQRGPVR